MASFTETVERRNPALIATGLAVWGLVIRIVIAVSVFFVPKVVTTATTLVQQGPVVKAVLADPAPVGHTTIGKVAPRSPPIRRSSRACRRSPRRRQPPTSDSW